jgi:hypothetical protein
LKKFDEQRTSATFLEKLKKEIFEDRGVDDLARLPGFPSCLEERLISPNVEKMDETLFFDLQEFRSSDASGY